MERTSASLSLKSALSTLGIVTAIGVILSIEPGALAQAGRANALPSSVLPSGGGQALLDPSDTAILLLDHQTGLFQTVKDISLTELRANTTMLAKLATIYNIPVITTASEPNGPNGPLMPEIHQSAPHAVYVPRKGEVNAWDNDDFVKTVRATGRRTLIMAGVWTSVCVMFPALDAKAAGYKVYAVTDASGDPSELASRTTLARLRAGRGCADHRECGAGRGAPNVEPSRSSRNCEAVCPDITELRRSSGEPQEEPRTRSSRE